MADPTNGGNGGNGGTGTAVKPDLVIGPNGDVPQRRAFESLSPCPFCDAMADESPEGIHDVHTIRKFRGANVGDPKWDFPHCWRCGYRPGINQAVSAKEMQRQFTAFQDWVASEQGKVFAGQPSIEGASSKQVQQQLDDMKAELDALKAQANNPKSTPAPKSSS